jgi:hypothetical protein
VPAFRLTPVAGKPRERGKAYGKLFAKEVKGFLDREIYKSFIGKPSPKDAMLRYAAACGKEVRAYSPEVHDEMEGLAEGAGRRVGEVVAARFEALALQAQAVAAPVQHLQAVADAVAEEEQVARERVGLQQAAHQGEQAVEAQAHVDGVGAVPELDGGREAQHGPPVRASIRERTKARSQPGARRRTAPPGRASSTAGAGARRTGRRRGSAAGGGAASRRFQE